MKFVKILSVLLMIALPVTVSAHTVEKLNMTAGQTELFRDITVDRISIGDDKVIDVEVLVESKEILVQALEPGFTDLRFWKDGVAKRFIVEVVNVQIGENQKAVADALRDIEGITVRGIGANVLIEGNVYSAQDAQRIDLIGKAFPNVVQLYTRPNLDMKNVISMEVKFVEMRKGVGRDFGIDWRNITGGFNFGILRDFSTNNLFRLGDSVGVSGDASGVGSGILDYGNDEYSYSGFSARADSLLQLLASNGYVRVLAEPTLSSASGAEARFQAGGRIPIPIQTQDGLSVDYEEYGLILTVTPQADSVGNISTEIELEVSDIDPNITVLGIPGFLTRETKTTVNLRADETIVLSGLVESTGSKTVNKLPGLGDVPILGELFKSREFLDNKSELYVFLTPRIISPQHETTTSSLDRAQKIDDEHGKNYRFNILD